MKHQDCGTSIPCSKFGFQGLTPLSHSSPHPHFVQWHGRVRKTGPASNDWIKALKLLPSHRPGGKGAKASFAVENQALVEADCDWIVLCPCGLDLEQTDKEVKAINRQPWWYALGLVPALSPADVLLAHLVLVSGEGRENVQHMKT